VNVPDLCGFYLLESHENVAAALSPALTAEQVEQMLTNCAFRVTKSSDGVYTATDYFGGGFPSKTNVFRLGEEQALGAVEDLEMTDAVLLVTMLGPSTVSYLLKDRASGRVQAGFNLLLRYNQRSVYVTRITINAAYMRLALQYNQRSVYATHITINARGIYICLKTIFIGAAFELHIFSPLATSREK
jgi:hypothetical protein